MKWSPAPLQTCRLLKENIVKSQNMLLGLKMSQRKPRIDLSVAMEMAKSSSLSCRSGADPFTLLWRKPRSQSWFWRWFDIDFSFTDTESQGPQGLVELRGRKLPQVCSGTTKRPEVNSIMPWRFSSCAGTVVHLYSVNGTSRLKA